MAESNPHGLDIFGVKPIAEAINKVTSSAIDGAAAVLSRICLPGAEEYGLLIKDKISGWRASNLIAIISKLEKRMIEYKVPEGAHASPRVVHEIIEKGSLADDSQIQDAVGTGLLATACTDSGNDESNLIFIDLLGRLTKLQAMVLKYACENAEKELYSPGLLISRSLVVSIGELRDISQENDIQRLDRELDHLNSLKLIKGGILFGDLSLPDQCDITPTPLALHMYVRCLGSRESPAEFFGISATQP